MTDEGTMNQHRVGVTKILYGVDYIKPTEDGVKTEFEEELEDEVPDQPLVCLCGKRFDTLEEAEDHVRRSGL